MVHWAVWLRVWGDRGDRRIHPYDVKAERLSRLPSFAEDASGIQTENIRSILYLLIQVQLDMLHS